MDEIELARYQEALVSALATGRDATDVRRRLSRSEATRPYADYLSRLEPRVVDLHAWLTRGWARREDEPAKIAEVTRAVVRGAFSGRLRSAAAKGVSAVRTPWVREWLRATRDVPLIEPGMLGDERIDSSRYYDIRTLIQARPLDLLGDAGVPSLEGKKVLELAYRSVLPLWLSGAVGARAVGVTGDPWKRAVHASFFERPTRALKLVEGTFPAPETRRAIGASYDVVLAWNAFKREPPDPALDVPQALAAVVRPGGHVVLYDADNASGGPRLRPPFPRERWARAGFHLLTFDRDDSRGLRAMARALEWPDVSRVRSRVSLLERG